MHKGFKNNILREESDHIIRVTYYCNKNNDLIKSNIGIRGGVYWSKDSGEAIIFQSPSESLDELVQKMTIQDVIKADYDKAIEQGYEEITREEFMQKVDEKFPGWRDE